jgi:hypothetical protein
MDRQTSNMVESNRVDDCQYGCGSIEHRNHWWPFVSCNTGRGKLHLTRRGSRGVAPNGGNHMEKKNKVHKIVGKGFTYYTFTDLTPEMIEYAKRDAAANGCVFLEASMEEFESSTGMVQLSDKTKPQESEGAE